MVGRGGAVGEILAAPQRIDDGCDRNDARHDVPPADAVAEPRGQRKQEEAQHQREGDMGVAQFLGRNDRVGRIKMKQAHDHGDRGRNPSRPAHQAVGRAFLGLDEGFRFLQRLLGDRDDIVIGRRFA
jgi:hypothetical protein